MKGRFVWMMILAVILMSFSALAEVEVDCTAESENDITATVVFQDGAWKAEVDYKVITDQVDGYNVFCHKIRSIYSNNGGVKTFRLLAVESPENEGYSTGTGDKDPISVNVQDYVENYDTITYIFGYYSTDTTNIKPGEDSSWLYYIADNSVLIGHGFHEVMNDQYLSDLGYQSGNPSRQVPEFSTLGLIAALAAIGLAFVFYKKKMAKKAQAKGTIIIALLAIVLVVSVGLILWKGGSAEPSAYFVKEVMPNGNVEIVGVSESTPSLAIAVEDGSGAEAIGIVPIEDGKTYLIG
jgi:hypothetical protein